jgi:hypothetical protein
MSLPSSGQISLSQFRTTFGGTAPDSVSEYYRGGANVADNAVNTSIPQSGTASFSDYYGGVGTATRNLQVNMDYGFSNSAVGLTSQSSTAAPSSFSVSSNSLCYQPVFHAGTGFITSASITVQQNEDVAANSEHVLLYGGTSSSTVTNIVGRWDAGSSGSQGGSRSYSIGWDADGLINAITYTGGVYNIGIISFVTDNVSGARSSGYTWYGFRLKNPSSYAKGSEIMTGTFYNSNSYTQPA